MMDFITTSRNKLLALFTTAYFDRADGTESDKEVEEMFDKIWLELNK